MNDHEHCGSSAGARPIPAGTIRNEDNSLNLPTGEVVAAEDVDESEDAPTVPSEFADAEDV